MSMIPWMRRFGPSDPALPGDISQTGTAEVVTAIRLCRDAVQRADPGGSVGESLPFHEDSRNRSPVRDQSITNFANIDRIRGLAELRSRERGSVHAHEHAFQQETLSCA